MANLIDLKLNYPFVAEEITAARNYFQNFPANADKNLFSFPAYQGNIETINLAAEWLKLPASVFPDCADIVLCYSGNHAVSCVLQALRPNNPVIITEPFTYPAFKTIASNYGYRLKPCEFDEEGMTLEGLKKAFDETGSKLLYLQPTIHNPTCVVMPLERRKQIAEYAVEKNILIIEDDAYRFLCKDAPLSFLDLMPENTFHIYSLSKPFNPLIKTALLVVPNFFKEKITDCVRLSSSGNSSLLSDFTSYLFQTKVLQDIIKRKQELAEKLQNIAIPILDELNFKTFPTSFHIWLKLPGNVRATDLVNKLKRQNISVPGGTDFLVGNSGQGEHFIRIALGAEKKRANLKKGLWTIASLLTK